MRGLYAILMTLLLMGFVKPMESSKSEDIVVIGAGIIGIAIAESFASMGRSVLIVDRKGVAEEASAGNAGALSFSDIFPLASPNILKKAQIGRAHV